MGSDHSAIEIDRWEKINNVDVPISQEGYYLDPDEISEDRTKALTLTDPYGVLSFAVGNDEDDDQDGDITIFFDFAELPDGRIALDSTINSESGSYIDKFLYEVVDPKDAAKAAQAMTDAALDVLFENGIVHDQEGWNQTPCYFARSVHAHVNNTGPVDRIPVDMVGRPIHTKDF